MNWTDRIKLHQPQETREFVGREEGYRRLAKAIGLENLTERERPGLRIAKGTERDEGRGR